MSHRVAEIGRALRFLVLKLGPAIVFLIVFSQLLRHESSQAFHPTYRTLLDSAPKGSGSTSIAALKYAPQGVPENVQRNLPSGVTSKRLVPQDGDVTSQPLLINRDTLAHILEVQLASGRRITNSDELLQEELQAEVIEFDERSARQAGVEVALSFVKKHPHLNQLGKLSHTESNPGGSFDEDRSRLMMDVRHSPETRQFFIDIKSRLPPASILEGQ